MANIFISYASSDITFAFQLATHLERVGHSIWVDWRKISIGTSLLRSIGEAIDQSDFLIVVLSKHTSASAWVEREWHVKYGEEITQGKIAILPVIIDECFIPPFLRLRRFADFRLGYEVGFDQLEAFSKISTQ